jgi:enoyl-CoA hydratase/carnithine racemase
MNFDNYRLDVADGIATVTFDRPPVNAQNRQTREEAIRIFDMISDRDDIRVAILTGAGKVFSAGADVKERVARIFLCALRLLKACDLRRQRRGIRRRLRADARLRHHDRGG